MVRETPSSENDSEEIQRYSCVFALVDVLSWFQRKKANLPKATIDPQELECLQKALGAPVPRALAYLLEKQNGGLWFNEFKVCPTCSLVTNYIPRFQHKTNNLIIPF